MLTVNSWTWNCWNRFHAVASFPLIVPYMTLQRLHPFVTKSWTKSPINSMDMPPKSPFGLYMDQSRVSRRTRNLVFNIDTLLTTTILSWFPPRDLKMSSIAVLALKLGVHVLNTLWKVGLCGKCEAPTPVGHVQRQISHWEASSWKILQVTKVFLVPPPACMNTSFCLDVSNILVKTLSWQLFNRSCWSKWESWSHWRLVNLSLQQSNSVFNFDHCSSVKQYFRIWLIRLFKLFHWEGCINNAK